MAALDYTAGSANDSSKELSELEDLAVAGDKDASVISASGKETVEKKKIRRPKRPPVLLKEDAEAEALDFIHLHDCMWNKKSDDHKNRDLVKSLWQELAVKLKLTCEFFTNLICFFNLPAFV